jgi:hypothetical protein
MDFHPSGKHFLDQVLEIQTPRSNALTHQEELSCVAASTGHPEMKTEPHVIIPFKLPSRAIKITHCWQIESQCETGMVLELQDLEEKNPKSSPLEIFPCI